MLGAPTFTSGALVFVPASPGMPLNHPTLATRGTCIPGSIGTLSVRVSPWQTSTPRELHLQQTDTTPVFLWKRLICLSWGSGLKDRLPIWNTSGGLQRCSQKGQQNYDDWWSILCLNSTGHTVSRLNIISGCVCKSKLTTKCVITLLILLWLLQQTITPALLKPGY